MNKNAIVYVEGFTKEGVEPYLKPIKEYCLREGLEIVEILIDETTYNVKNLDCLKILYKYMSSMEVGTIIFNSCDPYLSVKKYLMKFDIFPEFEILNFEYGYLDSKMTNFDKGNENILNQAIFDEQLSVDFGNLVERLSKKRDDLHFINREENARLVEGSKWSKQKAYCEFVKDKRILGVVFKEGNMSTMITHLAHESDMDKTGTTDAMIYRNYNDLEKVLSSNNYYKVIFDGLVAGTLDDFRELMLLCEKYAGEIQFCFGHLSSKDEYRLIEVLDELTGNA